MKKLLPHIVVTGSLGFDYIMDFSGKFADRIMNDKVHKISLGFLVDSLKKQFGGTAGNIAYSLRLLGMEPHIIAPAGNDFDPYLSFLKKAGVRTDGIVTHEDVATGSYFVVTDQEDNQIGSFYKGALKYAQDLSILGNEKTDLVMISPTDPEAMKKYVKECRAHHIPYMYDPAFQIGDFSPEVLKEGIEGSAIFIGNDYEIALVEQKLSLSHAQLLAITPMLITTLGAKGSVIETNGKRIEIAVAHPKDVSDPTGAGDAYRGGFLAGYLRGYDPQTCGRMGAVASVYTVEMYGTMTHTYTQKEFCARYKENFQETLAL